MNLSRFTLYFSNLGPSLLLWFIETPFPTFSRCRDINSKENEKKVVIDIPLRIPNLSFMISLKFTSLYISTQRARTFYSLQSYMYADYIFVSFSFFTRLWFRWIVVVRWKETISVSHTMECYAGKCGNHETQPFLYPYKSKAYRSYTNTEGNVMQGSFVIKLPLCYLFVITLETVSIVFPLLFFHVSVNINPHSFVDISLKSLFC